MPASENAESRPSPARPRRGSDTEAASTMGADDQTRFRTIILPLVRPYLISGYAFAFVLSLMLGCLAAFGLDRLDRRLRRLEEQGLLASQWKAENGPPRRYYSLSATGAELYRELSESWASLATVMSELLEGEKR